MSYSALDLVQMHDGCWAIEEMYASGLLARIDLWLQTADVDAHLEEYRAELRKQISHRSDLHQSEMNGGDGGGAAAPYTINDGVAMIPVNGPLTKQRNSLSSLFGGTSTSALADQIEHAAANTDVKEIFMDVDSPGGAVDGTERAAKAVAAAAKVKPVYAHIQDLGASAAYWIASQASDLRAGPAALVGSIGCYMVVTDSSEAAKRQGFEPKVIRSGKFKGAGTAGTPVTKEQIAEFQRMTDDRQEHFTTAVAKGRKMSMDAAQSVADGRVHVGKHAQDLNLIDGIASRSEHLARLKDARARREAAPKPNLTQTPALGANTDITPPDRYAAGNHPDRDTAAGPKEKPPMRTALASALSQMGMTTLAAKLLGASDDSAEAVAAQLKAEVTGISEQARTDATAQAGAHPLVVQLKAAGVETSEQLAVVLANAGVTASLLKADNEAMQKHAIIAFDAEEGQKMADAYAALPIGIGRDKLGAYIQAESLKKAPAEPGKRQSASGSQVPAQDADDAGRADAAKAEQDAAQVQADLNPETIFERRKKALNK